jgi:hypothetical protein
MPNDVTVDWGMKVGVLTHVKQNQKLCAVLD